MKWLPILACLGVIAWQQMPGRDTAIFPGDPAKRQALDRCFIEDRQFDRFDAAARAACFKGHGVEVGTVNSAPPSMRLAPPSPQANFVDLWKAAGQRQMHGNDIRAEQQTGYR